MRFCHRYYYRKRLQKMISDKAWECLMADEVYIASSKAPEPRIIYKQAWRLKILMRKFKNKH